MCIRCYEESYKTFCRCLFIENKCIRVGVTIDAGPLVIYVSFNDTKRSLLRKTSILEHGMPMADTDICGLECYLACSWRDRYNTDKKKQNRLPPKPHNRIMGLYLFNRQKT